MIPRTPKNSTRVERAPRTERSWNYAARGRDRSCRAGSMQTREQDRSAKRTDRSRRSRCSLRSSASARRTARPCSPAETREYVAYQRLLVAPERRQRCVASMPADTLLEPSPTDNPSERTRGPSVVPRRARHFRNRSDVPVAIGENPEPQAIRRKRADSPPGSRLPSSGTSVGPPHSLAAIGFSPTSRCPSSPPRST